MEYLYIVLALLAVPGLAIGGVWLVKEAGTHPWADKLLGSLARMTPAAYIPPPDLPREYTDQIPGGWDDLS
jgi:hypothetical protein